MQETRTITLSSNRQALVLSVSTILYALMVNKVAEIHVVGGKIYKTRMTLSELEKQLGDGFIKVHRGCLVSAMAIHDIDDCVRLSNGESLIYTLRKKNQLIRQFNEARRSIVSSFAENGVPMTGEEYRSHYSGFEQMPFAFTDIEMVFNEERHAVDWVFRYGNPALARLEKIPLERLIGSSFGSLFSNMDARWLPAYERAALYGETLEVIDYSPEIDACLKVICFPTFRGHCGCILFRLPEIRLTQTSSDAERTLQLYLGRLQEENR